MGSSDNEHSRGRGTDFGSGRGWQIGPEPDHGYRRGSSNLFESDQRRMNDFERSNYGFQQEDRGQRGPWSGRDSSYADARSGPGRGYQPQDGGPESFEDAYGRGYGESGFAASRPRARTLPKGYTRSDERIHDDVCERLSRSGIDVSEVSVSVSNGEVTLEGQVSDRRTKHALENCADECMGVKDVHNHIRVQRAE